MEAQCLCSAQAFQTLQPVALVFIWCVAWGKLCSFSVPHPLPLQGKETRVKEILWLTNISDAPTLCWQVVDGQTGNGTDKILWPSRSLHFRGKVHFHSYNKCFEGFPGGSMVKNLPAKQRLGFNSLVRKTPWRRKWQPNPVFLPGKSH